jgi:Zn-dependent protease with chaperone function
MPRQCSEETCVLFGIHTSSVTCPDCLNETWDPGARPSGPRRQIPKVASSESRAVTWNEQSSDPADHVTYLNDKNQLQTRWKKVLRKTVGEFFTIGIPIMCVAMVVAGRYPIPFALGAMFGTQMLLLRIRSKGLTGSLVDDDDTQSRITPPLVVLCGIADCALPQVCVRLSTAPAAMMLRKETPILLISTDFLAIADDIVLRAIIAHEVSHLSHGDLKAAKSFAQLLAVLWYVIYLFVIFVIGLRSWYGVAILFAFFLPSIQLMANIAGISWRRFEARADIDGATAINDPEAMIRGLQMVYDLVPAKRTKLFGPPSWRWVFFPFSLPDTRHPSLKTRIANLQALMPSDSSAREISPGA